ncbi:MAG: hypothetical protein HOY79_32740 [Streptomyces sp.]|nr:hypothetical protein [Streptomyces sp.]
MAACRVVARREAADAVGRRPALRNPEGRQLGIEYTEQGAWAKIRAHQESAAARTLTAVLRHVALAALHRADPCNGEDPADGAPRRLRRPPGLPGRGS